MLFHYIQGFITLGVFMKYDELMAQCETRAGVPFFCFVVLICLKFTGLCSAGENELLKYNLTRFLFFSATLNFSHFVVLNIITYFFHPTHYDHNDVLVTTLNRQKKLWKLL